MPQIYYDKDADMGLLKEKTIAVFGYGSQGHAQAQNLRDSGLKVVVSLLAGSRRWQRAEMDGFEVLEPAEAAKKGDFLQILTPDETQAALYKKYLQDNLEEHKILGFSHGFNIHFGQIVPPPFVDVIMIAPKGPGHIVRRLYTEGIGVPALLAVEQNHSGKAKAIALSYAKAIGATKAGVIETTFREETETDLFGEQAVLCGGVTELIRAGFDTLVEAGYQPEIAYFECLHELKLIVDLIYEGGISNMRYSVSDTAQYGDITRGKRIINDYTREVMQEILEEIQSGQFAREWIMENQANRPVFSALTRRDAHHPIEIVGEKLRALMPWMPKKVME